MQQSRVTELPNYVRIDVGDAPDAMAAHQSAAATCLHRGVSRVLLTSLDYQAQEVQEAVRCMIRMMALADEARSGMRIALVTRLASTAESYGSTCAFARGMGIEIRTFDNEKVAVEWLEGQGHDACMGDA